MIAPACYFEIPVSVLERAMRFYEAVFGCTLTLTEIDGNEMALFPPVPEARGISGALARGDSYVPGTQGVRLYLATEDIDATLEKVLLAGGKVMYPKTSVGDLGWVAEFSDSEGNTIALHSNPA